MIIKPYSTIAANIFSATDYPACKVFLKMNDAAGTSLTESVSGSTITAAAAFTSVTNGIRYSASGSGAVALPAAVPIGTKSALLMVVSNHSGFSVISAGTASAGYMKLAGSTGGGVLVSDGTNTATLAALTEGSILGHAVSVTPGTSNEGTSYECSLAAYTAPTTASAAAGDLASAPSITHFQSIASAIGNIDVYGIALFVFDNGIPADVKPAIAWMTAQWQAGVKAIYPGWKGKAL